MAEQDAHSNSGTESDIPNPKIGTASRKASVHEIDSQFETINRMKKLPVVEAAITQGQVVYGKVKRSNFLSFWMMSRAENIVQYAMAVSVPLVTPMMQKMIEPITFVDHTVAKGIDKLAVGAPIIEEQPDEIVRQVKGAISERISRKVEDLKASSYNRAHDVLDTKLGHVALCNVQRLLKITDMMLDKYFPYMDEEEYSEAVSKTPRSDPMDRTVDDITSVSRRISHIAQEKFKTIMNSSSSFMHPIQYTVSFFN